MIEIEAPDGSVVEFPDGTSDDVIKGAMAKTFGGPKTPKTTALGASSVGALSSLTANFGDEIMAGAMTPIEMGLQIARGESPSISGAYDAALEKNRAYEAQAREEHPVAATVGDIGGGLAMGGTMAKGGATLLNAAKPTLPSMAGRGAAEGALYGSAYGAGEGEGLEDRLEGAVTGGSIGAAGGAALGAIGARQAAKAGRQSVPALDEIKQQAQKLYTQAEKAGLQVSPQSFGNAVDDIAVEVSKAGIDKGIHPKAWSALNRLVSAKENYGKLGTGPGLKDLDILRRVVGAAAKSNEADERRVASIMIEKIDDYLGKLKPSDVTAGNARKAVRSIKEARKLWSRLRKGEIIGDLIERAEISAPNFSASGLENALRTEFRNLAKNSKRMRGFTPEERRAIKKVAKGGPIENALRMLGKFAPRGIVSSTLSGGAGWMLGGGPMGSAALMGAGELGRRGATAMTMNNVRAADALIRSGGQMPPPMLSPARSAVIQALTRMQAQEMPPAVEYISR